MPWLMATSGNGSRSGNRMKSDDIARALQRMIGRLTEVIEQVKAAVDSVAAGSRELNQHAGANVEWGPRNRPLPLKKPLPRWSR